MLSDIEIAQQAKMKKIVDVAASIGITEDELEPYGHYKAKISDSVMKRLEDKPDGKLVLVTAVNPTPAGEGKTTVSIGLGEAMAKIGKKAVIALREPSLGPVFGIKGGAAGGGYSQVVPMEDINLHFTGDMHAITSANNLMCAILDNHIQQGNELSIDPRRILVKRCLDMNDRALRNIVNSLGGKLNGVPREDHFVITVASEVMAILCLANDLFDLKRRLGNILVAYTYDGNPIYCKDIKAQGAMTVLLKDAIKPNLVQTLENTPAIMHGGPFANIAHGCNSVRATKTALKLADYCITEAGFGSDLGAEKFLDIKCRFADLKPSCVVLVSTVRSMKYNGGVAKTDLANENLDALEKGSVNLGAHIENLKKFGVPVVVAINHFYADTDKEIEFVKNYCESKGADFAVTKCFAEGGAGGTELAQKVVEACEKENNFHHLYDLDMPVYDKIETIAREIYGADGVDYTKEAKKSIDEFIALGADKIPVCMAKTQYSLSDNPTALGRPENFRITISSANLSNGAGFLVCQTGSIMTMPGLSKAPAAYKIDVDEDGNTVGLFLMKEYVTNNYEETVALGEKIAEEMPKGSVIAFLGGLGMGKTAFTTGFAKGLSIDADVSSPTFALCNTYIGKENVLYHFDMYRVDGWDDLYSTGFFDFLETDAYMAIEWSENVYGALPDDSLIVEIDRVNDNIRHFKMYKKSEDI